MMKNWVNHMWRMLLPCVLLLFPVSSQSKELVYAVTHFPPWVSIQDSEYSGIDVELVKELAQRLGLTLTFYQCPWQRCLNMMEWGGVDILSTVIKSPDRESYMQFLKPAYYLNSANVIYLKRGAKVHIETQQDLYSLNIGVVRGAKHSPEFDSDLNITKKKSAETFCY
ncbi:transporter substrate-binding domain-containing protein [Motilimonas cestriensis]|uniref:Transporter substrate-binding domain-containing protein n=1 Tax=Motilimonas cestriensis TaxID=2742685 RepID=A0ABS8WB29_9GAMM|nr:transporter substrate-binding domain-containing protein [Motilimonas cestriensis]MCE2595723.1 transporter substrate-binding domain-containing protein [Motilimonas cestriensis]